MLGIVTSLAVADLEFGSNKLVIKFSFNLLMLIMILFTFYFIFIFRSTYKGCWIPRGCGKCQRQNYGCIGHKGKHGVSAQ